MAYPNTYPDAYLQGMDKQDPSAPITPPVGAAAAPVLKKPGMKASDDPTLGAAPAPIPAAAPALNNVNGSATTVLQPPARTTTAAAAPASSADALNSGAAPGVIQPPESYQGLRQIAAAFNGTDLGPQATMAAMNGGVGPSLSRVQGSAFPSTGPSFAGVQGSATTTPLPGSAPAVAPGMIPAAPSPIVAAAASAPSSAAGGAINAQGKRLPYGAMVNGVATFSDGSSGIPGIAGSIPRTMSDATIAGLGSQLNVVPATAFTGATPGAAAPQLVRPAAQPITGSRPSAQDFADADRLAVASQDPRSAAGIVARNLSMEAQYGGTTRVRRAAEQSLASLQAGTQQSGLEAQQAEQQNNVLTRQGQNELANTALQGQNSLADAGVQLQRAQLTRERQPVTLADGTLATRDPVTGVVTPSTLANGQPAKDKRTNEVLDSISKTATELSKSALPPPGAPANWTPDPVALREQAARMNGLPLGTDPKTGKRFVQINGQALPL
jgi:hypothetical protein